MDVDIWAPDTTVRSHPRKMVIGDQEMHLLHDDGAVPDEATWRSIAETVTDHRIQNPETATTCVILQRPGLPGYIVVSPSLIIATLNKDFADKCLASGIGEVGP